MTNSLSISVYTFVSRVFNWLERGIKFSIEKCAWLIMKSNRKETTEDEELPSQ